jgi:hypothetical protein
MGLFVTDATFAWDGKVQPSLIVLSFAYTAISGRKTHEVSRELHRHTPLH